MKKINFFWAIALVLPLVFTLSGCAPNEEDDPPPSVKKMTFEKDNVRFTIKSNFDFEVVFLDEVEVITGMSFKETERVWGKFTDREPSKAKWTNDFSGSADIKGAETADPILKNQASAVEIPITVTYTKDGGDITALNLDIDENAGFEAAIGKAMMGGNYQKKD